MTKQPQILERKIAAESRIFKIEEIHLRFSNGNERIYERMRSGSRGAIMVVPMLDDETIILIREYSVGTERYELGFPKGLIDPGETAEAAANRELQEEIGYGSKNIELLSRMTAVPGYWGGRADIFTATDLYESWLEGDEPEPLEIVPWKLSNYKALLAEETFSEARSIAALMLLRDKLNGY